MVLASLDERVLRAFRTLPHGPAADRGAIAMSRVADHGALWVGAALAGAALDRGRARRWVAGGATVLGTEQLSRAVKRAVRRPRPVLDGLPPLAPVTSRYSFPSSHTATAVVAIDAFGGLLPRPPLVAWAVLTGASRPYLGVHWPSDVLAGAVLGRAVGLVFARLARGRRAAGSRQRPGALADARPPLDHPGRPHEVRLAWCPGLRGSRSFPPRPPGGT